jgi:hypothetical protein
LIQAGREVCGNTSLDALFEIIMNLSVDAVGAAVFYSSRRPDGSGAGGADERGHPYRTGAAGRNRKGRETARELHAAMIPAREVAGDLFDFSCSMRSTSGS